MTEGNRRGKALQMERNDRNVDKKLKVLKLYVRMVKRLTGSIQRNQNVNSSEI